MPNGLDMSHYQSDNAPIDWEKLEDSDAEFIYFKASQGTSYKDPKFEYNIEMGRSIGKKVSAYHFVTNANSIEQHAWFLKCVGDHKLDFPAGLDCEAFTDYSAKVVPGMENEVQVVTALRQYPLSEERREKIIFALPGLEYPSQAVADRIANKLRGYQGFPVPAIYTNLDTGNRVFTYASWKDYLIWMALWGDKLVHPNVWKNEKNFMWQKGVISGTPYGIKGQVDFDTWGDKLPFPSVTPPATSPIRFTIGKVSYEGSIKKEN